MTSAKRMTAVTVAFSLVVGATCALAQDWPQWRGPTRDNHVTGFKAPTTWPKELTKKWRVKVGVGESSPVLTGDKVYAFARQGDDEVLVCLDAATGQEVWKKGYTADPVKGNASGFPGPRSTPAVGGGKVCTLGVAGTVTCFDAATGEKIWQKETKGKPQFYTSSSPMIVDGKCIVYVSNLTAYDLAKGDVKWEWKGGGIPYGSPTLMTVDGVRQVVTPTVGAVAGVDLAEGKGLWQVKVGSGEKFDYQTTFSTPIIDGATVIYTAASKGKAGTSIALKVAKKDGAFKTEEVWKKPEAADKYHTPLLKDGLLYGVRSQGRSFFCWDAKTGKELWKDETKRGECGCILDVGAVLIALTSDKELIAFKASNQKYDEVVKYEVAGEPTWAVPILSGNRIYVRDKAGSLTLWTLE